MTRTGIVLVSLAAVTAAGAFVIRSGGMSAGHALRVLGVEISMRVDIGRAPGAGPDPATAICAWPDTVIVLPPAEGP